jgi:hypothetical protein
MSNALDVPCDAKKPELVLELSASLLIREAAESKNGEANP